MVVAAEGRAGHDRDLGLFEQPLGEPGRASGSPLSSVRKQAETSGKA